MYVYQWYKKDPTGTPVSQHGKYCLHTMCVFKNKSSVLYVNAYYITQPCIIMDRRNACY